MFSRLKRAFFFNSSRVRLEQENRLFAESIPANALVLDAGAGNQPYRELFNHARYESADFEKVNKKYAKSTYVCDLRSIPVEANRFDFIVFNQVMEHLPDPRAVLSEFHRVLKPSGKLIYTGPLFYEEHEEPYDFFRYTQFGLTLLFDEAGFKCERLDWLEGYFSTIGYQLNRMALYTPVKPKDISNGFLGYLMSPFLILFKVTCGILSMFFHRLELKHKYKTRGYPKNYVGIYVKE